MNLCTNLHFESTVHDQLLKPGSVMASKRETIAEMEGRPLSPPRRAFQTKPRGRSAKIVETAGEALAKAGFEPSKAGRRIVGQGKPREPLRKRTCRTEKTEEEKVFIYDIALLLNDFTRERHPGLLVHDNIFDVDNDTLEKSLEYLLTRAPFDDGQQYILTLNVDRLERYSDEAWYEELGQNVVASFTKSNRFLKVKYQEIGS